MVSTPTHGAFHTIRKQPPRDGKRSNTPRDGLPPHTCPTQHARVRVAWQGTGLTKTRQAGSYLDGWADRYAPPASTMHGWNQTTRSHGRHAATLLSPLNANGVPRQRPRPLDKRCARVNVFPLVHLAVFSRSYLALQAKVARRRTVGSPTPARCPVETWHRSAVAQRHSGTRTGSSRHRH